jgi:hypothetical protein
MNFYSILGSYEFLLAFVEELFFLKHFIRHKKTKKQKNKKTFIEILATTTATFKVADIEVEHT